MVPRMERVRRSAGEGFRAPFGLAGEKRLKWRGWRGRLKGRY